MPEKSIQEFRLLPDPETGQGYDVYRALSPDKEPIRIILFDEAVSGSAAFRSAFRRDQPSLARINHPHILCPVTWGEDQGKFFFVTEPAPELTLRQILSGAHSHSWEELIDISWQIASAIQHLHNLGLSAGTLSIDSIGVTDSLRTTLTTVGITRWLGARHPLKGSFGSGINDGMADDLRQLGKLLQDLAKFGPVDDEDTASANEHIEFESLIAQLQETPCRLTARDIQGHLGDLLLRQSGDSMELLDNREQQAPRRSAIMDDLFDDPELTVEPVGPVTTEPHATNNRLIYVLIALTVAGLAALYAVTTD